MPRPKPNSVTPRRAATALAAMLAISVVASGCGGEAPEPATTTPTSVPDDAASAEPGDEATATAIIGGGAATIAALIEISEDVAVPGPAATHPCDAADADIEDGLCVTPDGQVYADAGAGQWVATDSGQPPDATALDPDTGAEEPQDPAAEQEPEAMLVVDPVVVPEGVKAAELEPTVTTVAPELEPTVAPEPEQGPDEDQPALELEQPEEEAEPVAETPTSTVPPQEDGQPEDNEADDIYEATTTAVIAIGDLIDQVVVLLDSGNTADACALVAGARAVADAHQAAHDPSVLAQDANWLEWLDALAGWEAACTQALAEPELTDYEIFVAAVQQGQGWTGTDSPPMHLETRPPSWERVTNEKGGRPDDRPRATEGVQAWTDWCGAYYSCEALLFRMVWPLDYMGANEQCVLDNYYNRVIEENQPGVGDAARARLRDEYGWHRCATVIDPVQPDGRLLSEHGVTMAERCRTVLPADVKLEFRVFVGLSYQLRDNATCDEWGTYVEGRGVRAKNCDRSARLAEEWLEHYIGMPEPYWSPTC